MGIGTRCLMRGLGCLLLVPALALAQTEAGKIVGTVRDPSNAVLPGVTVTLVSVERATVRTTVTDAAGIYVFAGLVPGGYEVSAELSGFVPGKGQAAVPVGATVTLDLTLTLGAQAETITVTAESMAAINTSTQDISTTVTGIQIQQLPVITRNPYDLVAISGNVVRDDASASRGTGFVMNGLRSAGTNVLLDGGANNDEFAATVGQDVPLDAVQEFSVITSNFSAQFGRASAGIVNVATKSGTNAFHPSLDSNFYYGEGANRYEQIRNGRVWPAPESPVRGLWRPDWVAPASSSPDATHWASRRTT